MLHYCPSLSPNIFPSQQSIYCQINATHQQEIKSNNGQVPGILFPVSIYPTEVYLWQNAGGGKSAYSEENNGCCVNTDTYGKVLCEYNFCDLQGKILMDIFF